MQKYTIFRISCGFFGILSANGAVFRTCLPVKTKAKCAQILLGSSGYTNTNPGTIENDSANSLCSSDDAVVDNLFLADVAELVRAYYNGSCVDFSSVSVNLENRTDFARKVLLTLKRLKYGQTITYGDLAKKAGFPRAGRAVGTALANNPMPLIIPCHRVICADGSIGNFSAPGGPAAKKHMLNLENQKTYNP